MDDIFLQLSKITETGSVSAQSGSSDSFSSAEEELFVNDYLVSPDIKPRKVTAEKPVVLVVDDDFATLDLMKIYLQREYEYISFDNPKDAIFWLNTHVPDLIFIDCYLTMIPSKRVIEIVRSYKESANVPMFYLSEQVELGAVSGKLPEGVLGCISRPVSRGDLQGVLNYVFSVVNTDAGSGASPEEDVNIDDALSLADSIDESGEILI